MECDVFESELAGKFFEVRPVFAVAYDVQRPVGVVTLPTYGTTFGTQRLLEGV